MQKYIDSYFILEVAPHYTKDAGKRQLEIVTAISPVFYPTLVDYEISTIKRIAHFMGQITHECAGFSTTEEFASGKAYEGRKDLGNISPGDGVRYKGRGLIQLTGRSNYKLIGDKLGLPLEDNPELAAEPVNALKIACEYWKSRSINTMADLDDLNKVTRLVNGGLNGLGDRRKYYTKANELLDGLFDLSKVRLELKADGFFVKLLQRLLNTKGFKLVPDGDFGNATDRAVKIFQSRNKLKPDGIVGKNTWAILAK